MPFQSFNHFSFMLDKLKTPLRVLVDNVDNEPQYDDTGKLIPTAPTAYDVEEPLQLATSNTASNFGTSYPHSDGGAVPISTVYWISQAYHYLPVNTKVIDLTRHITYRVTQSTDNPVSGLTYYALENTNDTKGDDEDILPNN